MNRRDQFFIMTAVGLATLAPCIWLSGAAVDYPGAEALKNQIAALDAEEVGIREIFPGAWKSIDVTCAEDSTQTLKFVTNSESQNLNTPRFKLPLETLNLCAEGSKSFEHTDSVALKN